MSHTRTKHIKGFFSSEESNNVYKHLIGNIKWEEGIRSRKGFTRLAKAITVDYDPIIESMIYRANCAFPEISNCIFMGIYLNYYHDGTMWTPAHSHKKQKQVIISLGATRTLKIGNKNYSSGNGDIFLFGSSIHEVPKEPQITEGRISIAIFYLPNDIKF